MIIQFIKIAVIYCLRIILCLFHIVPINKRKIIFASYGGKQYSCNPKYIFEYMIKHYSNRYIYIWSLNNPGMLPSEYDNVKIVKFLSLGYLFHVLTAGYVIYNSMIKCYLPLRKNQIVVNTWHGGGAYKKMGSDAIPYQKDSISMKVARDIRAKMVTYIISSCERFTAVSSKLWMVPVTKYLTIGMPRNDMLFEIPDSIINKIKKNLDIDNGKKIILYAPTYRGDYRSADTNIFSIDISCLLQALGKRFKNNFIILFRSHIYDKSNFNINQENIVLVSNYPDIQELFCISDVLITDYSSCIWDFSFTFRPCFIYAPDLSMYKETTGFYTPIEEWPFPLAETNEDLIKNILEFDEEEYKKSLVKHHEDLGSFEKGIAAKQFCEKVFFDK